MSAKVLAICKRLATKTLGAEPPSFVRTTKALLKTAEQLFRRGALTRKEAVEFGKFVHRKAIAEVLRVQKKRARPAKKRGRR